MHETYRVYSREENMFWKSYLRLSHYETRSTVTSFFILDTNENSLFPDWKCHLLPLLSI